MLLPGRNIAIWLPGRHRSRSPLPSALIHGESLGRTNTGSQETSSGGSRNTAQNAEPFPAEQSASTSTYQSSGHTGSSDLLELVSEGVQ